MRVDYDKDQLAYALAYALRERDKIQTELEMWRDGNILHEVHRNELEKVEQERDEAREEVKLLKAILDLIKKDVS